MQIEAKKLDFCGLELSDDSETIPIDKTHEYSKLIQYEAIPHTLGDSTVPKVILELGRSFACMLCYLCIPFWGDLIVLEISDLVCQHAIESSKILLNLRRGMWKDAGNQIWEESEQLHLSNSRDFAFRKWSKNVSKHDRLQRAWSYAYIVVRSMVTPKTLEIVIRFLIIANWRV